MTVVQQMVNNIVQKEFKAQMLMKLSVYRRLWTRTIKVEWKDKCLGLKVISRGS